MSDNKQYADTMLLEKELIYNGNLLLVNKNYPLKNPKVEKLVPIDKTFPDILMKPFICYRKYWIILGQIIILFL